MNYRSKHQIQIWNIKHWKWHAIKFQSKITLFSFRMLSSNCSWIKTLRCVFRSFERCYNLSPPKISHWRPKLLFKLVLIAIILFHAWISAFIGFRWRTLVSTCACIHLFIEISKMSSSRAVLGMPSTLK